MTDPSSDQPVPVVDLERLLAGLTGPVAALAGVVVETVGGAVKVLLEQAYRSGQAAGRADAEHRVARAVGTDAGGGQVWSRCGTCGGDGIVAAAPPHAPAVALDMRDTAVIPPIGPGDTAILPRYNEGPSTYRNTNDQRRRG